MYTAKATETSGSWSQDRFACALQKELWTLLRKVNQHGSRSVPLNHLLSLCGFTRTREQLLRSAGVSSNLMKRCILLLKYLVDTNEKYVKDIFRSFKRVQNIVISNGLCPENILILLTRDCDRLNLSSPFKGKSKIVLPRNLSVVRDILNYNYRLEPIPEEFSLYNLESLKLLINQETYATFRRYKFLKNYYSFKMTFKDFQIMEKQLVGMSTDVPLPMCEAGFSNLIYKLNTTKYKKLSSVQVDEIRNKLLSRQGTISDLDGRRLNNANLRGRPFINGLLSLLQNSVVHGQDKLKSQPIVATKSEVSYDEDRIVTFNSLSQSTKDAIVSLGAQDTWNIDPASEFYMNGRVYGRGVYRGSPRCKFGVLWHNKSCGKLKPTQDSEARIPNNSKRYNSYFSAEEEWKCSNLLDQPPEGLTNKCIRLHVRGNKDLCPKASIGEISHFFEQLNLPMEEAYLNSIF